MCSCCFTNVVRSPNTLCLTPNAYINWIFAHKSALINLKPYITSGYVPYCQVDAKNILQEFEKCSEHC